MDNIRPTLEDLLDQHTRRQRNPTRSVSALVGIPQSPNPDLRCCCGDHDCPFLRGGKEAISGLERDVKAAATVGQALLARHEAYVADADQERSRMTSAITELEEKNKDVETKYAQAIEENKALVLRIDELNTSITEADEHIKSITSTLTSTQREMQKLNVLASRTQVLETQLCELEAEQARLQQTIISTKEGERAAQQQWRTSQRKVMELLDQIDGIEKEAREERLRHEEVVEQFKKKQSFVDDFNVDGLSGDQLIMREGKKGVVSQFVQGLLEDNAKLSLSMVELRELLTISNEQVEELREQMTLTGYPEKGPAASLSTELTAEPKSSQEVHVHHHYHATSNSPQTATKPRLQPYQRPRRKRQQVITSGRSTPRSSVSYGQHPPPLFPRDSDSSVISPESPPRSNRWSQLSRSSFAPSTVPSSPRSNAAPSTIFSRAFGDDATDYSRPTSPESGGIWSPSIVPFHKHDQSEDSTFQPSSLPTRASTGFSFPGPSQSLTPVVNEEEEEDLDLETNLSLSPVRQSPTRTAFTEENSQSALRSETPVKTIPPSRSGLQRSSSHASLISVSGMDIHSAFASSPMPSILRPGLRTATAQSSGAIVSTESAQAFRYGVGTRNILEKGLSRKIGQPAKNEDRYVPLVDTFGSRVGGWLSSKWVGNSTRSTLDNVQETSEDDRSKSEQTGGRLWFGKAKKPTSPKRPRNVQVSPLDEDALRECLIEEEEEIEWVAEDAVAT